MREEQTIIPVQHFVWICKYAVEYNGLHKGPVEHPKGCVHTVALPFTLKRSILRQKKNLRKLKYLNMQKYNLQKNSTK
jgi:hypothetical protein